MAKEKLMRGERPGDLRQEINRVRASRDHLKEVSRDKTITNKRLRDRTVELADNRDKWKDKSKELAQQLKTSQEKLELEKKRADQEQERADRLQAEVEMVWGKKS